MTPIESTGVMLAAVEWGFIIFLLVGALFWIANNIDERRRSDRLVTVAKRMGFEFLGGKPSSIFQEGDFEIAKKGHGSQNLVKGQRENIEIEIFGFEVSDGEDSTIVTICALRSPSVELPKCQLYPQGIFSGIATAFGAQDIEFDSNPEFSRMFVVKGDENRVREVVTDEVMAFLCKRPKVSIEGNGDSLICFREGWRVKPEHFESLVEHGVRLVHLLAKKTSAPVQPLSSVVEEDQSSHRPGRCPLCRGALKLTQLEGISVDQCSSCQGVWFDHGEFQQYEKRLRWSGDDTSHFIPNLAKAPVLCPRCDSASLRPGRVWQWEWWRCEKCFGFFLDKEEMVAFTEGVKGSR